MKIEISEKGKIIVSFFASLSMIGCLLIPLMYVKSKKCRHHPSQIFLAISICECLSSYYLLFWAIDPEEAIDFIYLDKIISSLLFESLNNKDSKINLCLINYILYYFLFMASVCYNICLCIDLIITIKYPLMPGNKRNKYYHMFVLINTIISLIVVGSDIKTNRCIQKDRDLYYDSLYFVIYIIIFFMTGIVSIVMGLLDYRKIPNNKLNSAKKRYLIRHTINVFVLTILWLLPLIHYLFNKMSIENDQYDFSIIEIIIFASTMSIGLILTLLRLSERYYWFRFKIFVSSFFKKVSEKDLKTIEEIEDNDDQDCEIWNTSIYSLINSTLNVEVVKYILVSIIEILKDNQDNNLNSFNYTIENLKNLIKERKKMKINKLDLEIMRKKTKEINKFKRKTNSILNSIQKFASRFSLRKKNDINENEEVQNEKLNNIEKPLTATIPEQPTEIISISLNIVEYAPKIFQYLRKKDGIEYNTILESLNIFSNEANIKQAKQSSGKSGSFFFFSHDKRFLLKTISITELETLFSLLQNYFNYIINENPESLLSRMYGAFSINIGGMSQIHLILMENTLAENNEKLKKIYDLKGSLINRKTNIKTNESQILATKSFGFPHSHFDNKREIHLFNKNSHDKKDMMNLKDMNFLESEDLFIIMEQSQKENFIENITKDAYFLKNNRIMDYSLLFAIGDGKYVEKTKEYDGFLKFRCMMSCYKFKKEVWSFAIIDYLQTFNSLKYLEYRYKGILNYKNSYYVSCIDPITYSERFINFINSITCALIA